MNNLRPDWNRILSALEKSIKEQSFRTWFTDTQMIDCSNNNIIVRVPTKIAASFLNQNYTDTISEVIYELYNEKYLVKFTNEIINLDVEPKKLNKHAIESLKVKSRLNPKYTFEQFIVGKSNNFAHSASMAVAESPGTNYNPLFIYGESGMGKTHLMQAIAHFCINNGFNKTYYYTTTEEFTNEMIESLRSNNMQNFRNKYRNIDLLMIDDVHFLSKKEGTQEEFFHTFNALYENRKQIVITSDRPPKEIRDLEQRLVTRFEWGLLADLKSPDFETRVAILKKKAESENIYLQQDIFDYIAENIYSNVRALEGSLIRVLAFASYNKINPEDITIETAKYILKDMISEKEKDITMDKVMQKTCSFYNLTPGQILEDTRKKNIAFPRQIAMYLSNLLIPQISLKEIALYYKRKDHTTVLHAKKLVESLFRDDNDFRAQIEKLIKEIKSEY
ncbi:MAG: chromosomal replication initiator protein DnaA [Candidatus Cloacimonetes bacterium]|nr:chromosomal replication initiator protein DnaA [Candidatus Cloacimonadota bacterium]